MGTFRASSLAPDELPLSQKYLRNFSVVVSDIDYTLLDFAPGHLAGISRLEGAMGKDFAAMVNRCFELMLEGQRLLSADQWQDRDEFNQLMEGTKRLHETFGDEYGHKVWSRETWIVLAAAKLGVRIDAAKVKDLRDQYWQGVSDNSQIYPDAQKLLGYLHSANLPLILMTGSDSILEINDDLTFAYDPVISESYKLNRLKRINLRAESIIVGDPIDKPDDRFFEKLFTEMLRKTGVTDKNSVLVIGDSQRNDLEVPSKLGYPTLLIKRS